MTVCRHFAAVIACCALMLGAGCGDRDHAQLPAETDEPLYVQGVQLNKQGRRAEALMSFQKLIEQRGDRASAESHLEVAVLYLKHMKDPLKAYYHCTKYIELQPNSKEAPFVRSLVDEAKREFARTLPGAPRDETTFGARADLVPDPEKELERLRRENTELRAELQTLRGAATTVSRAPRMISVPLGAEPATRPAAPPPTTKSGPIVAAPPPQSMRPAVAQAAPMVQATAPVTRPSTTAARPPAATPKSGRTHTVQPKQTLYAIAKQYNVKLEELARANGITNPSSVPVGTVLRIP